MIVSRNLEFNISPLVQYYITFALGIEAVVVKGCLLGKPTAMRIWIDYESYFFASDTNQFLRFTYWSRPYES